MKTQGALAGTTGRAGTLALSVEFVAKPEKAVSARTLLPEAIQGALKEVDGFAGCVVLGSEYEARLITVITFWTGSDCRQRCQQNERWVHALLSSYMDRRLRVQTMVAHSPVAPVAHAEELLASTPGEEADENGSLMQECGVDEGNLCAVPCV